MTTHYAITTKHRSATIPPSHFVSYDEGYQGQSLDKAIESAMELLDMENHEWRVLNIVSIDMATGAVNLIRNRNQLLSEQSRRIAAEQSADIEERRYGSYESQHRQTVADVM